MADANQNPEVDVSGKKVKELLPVGEMMTQHLTNEARTSQSVPAESDGKDQESI